MPIPASFDPTELVQEKLSKTILHLPESYLSCSENELREIVKPNPTDWKMRIRFWGLYEDVTKRSTRNIKIQGTRIHAGIISAPYFEQYIQNPKKVAFMTRPVADFKEDHDVLTVMGTERLFEIMSMDITDTKMGGVDPRKAGILLQTIQMIHDRSRGMAIQRTQALNVNIAPGQSQVPIKISDPKELDAEITKLQNKLKGRKPKSEVIEIESKES